jgi:hypothetical protein
VTAVDYTAVAAPGVATASVSVVLPCLDEADAVGAVVAEALAGLEAGGFRGEVIVVDNGSRDGSPERAAAAGARVVFESARGYGAALRAGFAAATGDVVVMADADQTYDLSQLHRLVAPVAAGDVEMMVGRRVADGSMPMPLLHRFVGTPMLNRLIAGASGMHVGDSQSGFRAIRRDTLQSLGLTSTGMELASEMIVKAAWRGLRIDEVALPYRARVGESKLVTWSDGWRHFRQLVFLAPHILLVRPGAFLAAVGALFAALGVFSPAGVVVGSLRWQPIFFSTILMVLGLQASLAGLVIQHRGAVAHAPGAHRSIVGHPRFVIRCGAAAAVALASGLLVDGLLFFRWVGGAAPSAAVLALAGIAQSLLLVGGSLASFAVVYALSEHGADR